MASHWLQASVEGYCGVTLDGRSDSCETGLKGSWGLEREPSTLTAAQRQQMRWTWPAAVQACLARCATCARCRYFTVSPASYDCSWFYICDLPALELSIGYRRDPAYRSSRMPSIGDAWAQAAPTCRKLTIEGATLQHAPPPSPAAPSPPTLPVSLLPIDDVRCPERYVSVTRCADRIFFFSRHDLGDHKRMQTLVRVWEPPATLSRAQRDAALLSPPRFHNVTMGLPHATLMSHNTAFHCVHDRMLVAYGGMAHTPDQSDWQGADIGIMRTVADASKWPLSWSTPQLAVGGDPERTGCVDENMETTLCEYDGKLSVVTFRGKVLLYTRSNLSPMGGARHVQVTTSADGVSRWSPFEQIRIRGYRYGPAHAKNNVYFWTVRPLPLSLSAGGGQQQLAAFFPGVIDLVGGVFFCTSRDGIHWSRPVRLLESPHDNSFRTRDYPVDGWLESLALSPPPPSSASSDDDTLRLTIQHRVDLRGEAIDDDSCPAKPYFCTYQLSIAALLNAYKWASKATANGGGSARQRVGGAMFRLSSMERARQQPRPLSPERRAASAVRTMASGVGAFALDMLKAIFLRRPQSGAGATGGGTISRGGAVAVSPSSSSENATVAAVREYLGAVYPAARKILSAMGEEELVYHFESLDYYYHCDPRALTDVRPPLRGCARLARQNGKSVEPPQLPYLPRGAYYTSASTVAAKPFADASYLRHRTPIHVADTHRSGEALRGFHSQAAAKVGPAPSWTTPLALTRYPLFPVGMHIDGLGGEGGSIAERPSRETSDGLTVFAVGNLSRVQRLLSLRDGELVEVEQWGGWNADACPPICGLWGNVWKGTGTMMRVSRPYASLSKTTAIVEMVLELGTRNATALNALTTQLKLDADVAMSHAKFPTATLAECLAHALLTVSHPCEGADPRKQLLPLVNLWMRRARRRSPSLVVAELTGIASESSGPRFMAAHRLALHWIYAICGVGPFYARAGIGWDAMLAALACMLGYHTVVLAASPNDNGLLHQEFVDFDLPEGLGWGVPPNGGTNDAARCFHPFEFALADKRAGPRAVAYRRREMLRHWQRSEKFVLPRQDTAEFVLPVQAAGTALGCQLRFGDGVDAAGDIASCTISPQDENLPPTAAKACYAWCEGAMSQAHSSVSLFHMQQPSVAPATASKK